MGWHLTTLSPRSIGVPWAAARQGKTGQDMLNFIANYILVIVFKICIQRLTPVDPDGGPTPGAPASLVLAHDDKNHKN